MDQRVADDGRHDRVERLFERSQKAFAVVAFHDENEEALEVRSL
jgi:hypothetical protein